MASLIEAFNIASSLTLPYVLNPIEGIQTYFPTMWPFSTSVKFNPENDIPDLADKVILVTGGNNGIGKETVLQLAKHQPRQIFLAARTESKARDAIASIQSEVKNANIEFLHLDLSSLKSVQTAAAEFQTKADRLDILILNAGIMATPPGKTETGQDIQLGTNHFGHFLLFKKLLPTLEKTAALPGSDVRVIAVASEAHNMAPSIDTITSTEKLVKTGPWTRYGASKASNVMFAAELARRYPQFTSVSLHPGMIKTDLYAPSSSSSSILKYGVALFSPLFFMDVPHGAWNQLYTGAGAPKTALVNGGYYKPFGIHQKIKWSENKSHAEKLWTWTEQELKAAGY